VIYVWKIFTQVENKAVRKTLRPTIYDFQEWRIHYKAMTWTSSSIVTAGEKHSGSPFTTGRDKAVILSPPILDPDWPCLVFLTLITTTHSHLSSILTMEAEGSSKISVTFYMTIQHYNTGEHLILALNNADMLMSSVWNMQPDQFNKQHNSGPPVGNYTFMPVCLKGQQEGIRYRLKKCGDTLK
jgi:hypothetical protein